VLRPDPLTWFAHEKVADEAAEFAPEPYQIPRQLTRAKSLVSEDPGERALAGFLSVTGSLSAKLTPMAARAIGRLAGGGDSNNWTGPPIQGVSSIREAQGAMFKQDPSKPVNRQHRVLGLFDVRQSHPPLDDAGLLQSMKRYQHLDNVQDVVDSYIKKHDLKRQGLRMNFQRGPLSGMSGSTYNPATKEVTLPSMGKETILHELGHVADYTTRTGRVRAMIEPALQRSVLMALPIALAAGDRIKEMIPGTIDDKTISFLQDHAPGIMAGTLAATTLYPEAKASISAIKHIRDLERLGKQPAGAAMAAFKRLGPGFATYLMTSIPAIAGMALARKYMYQARAEKREKFDIQDLEKTSSIIRGFVQGAREVGGVVRQIASGAADLITEPGTLRRVGRAAAEVGTSPEFIRGALGAAVPAALGALYMYSTPSGAAVRERLHPETRARLMGHTPMAVGPVALQTEQWRGEHPLRFAGLVGMGAALSGGIISRLVADLTRVT